MSGTPGVLLREVVLISLAAWDIGVTQLRIVITPAVEAVAAVVADPGAGIAGVAAFRLLQPQRP